MMSRAQIIDQVTKQRALQEYLDGASATEVAKRYSISVKLLYNWKFKATKQASTANVKDMDSAKRIKHLEREISHRNDEIMVLRELLKKTYQVMPLSAK